MSDTFRFKQMAKAFEFLMAKFTYHQDTRSQNKPLVTNELVNREVFTKYSNENAFFLVKMLALGSGIEIASETVENLLACETAPTFAVLAEHIKKLSNEASEEEKILFTQCSNILTCWYKNGDKIGDKNFKLLVSRTKEQAETFITYDFSTNSNNKTINNYINSFHQAARSNDSQFVVKKISIPRKLVFELLRHQLDKYNFSIDLSIEHVVKFVHTKQHDSSHELNLISKSVCMGFYIELMDILFLTDKNFNVSRVNLAVVKANILWVLQLLRTEYPINITQLMILKRAVLDAFECNPGLFGNDPLILYAAIAATVVCFRRSYEINKLGETASLYPGGPLRLILQNLANMAFKPEKAPNSVNEQESQPLLSEQQNHTSPKYHRALHLISACIASLQDSIVSAAEVYIFWRLIEILWVTNDAEYRGDPTYKYIVCFLVLIISTIFDLMFYGRIDCIKVAKPEKIKAILATAKTILSGMGLLGALLTDLYAKLMIDIATANRKTQTIDYVQISFLVFSMLIWFAVALKTNLRALKYLDGKTSIYMITDFDEEKDLSGRIKGFLQKPLLAFLASLVRTTGIVFPLCAEIQAMLKDQNPTESIIPGYYEQVPSYIGQSPLPTAMLILLYFCILPVFYWLYRF